MIGALATCAIAVLPLPAAAAVGIYVDVAPPAPRHEVVPAPRAGYLWVPGFWDWRGNRHVWSKGRWERARSGYHFHPNRWEMHDGRWQLERGRWDRERYVENHHNGHGDRDHDGVPNRYDNAPNNPHRR